MTARLKIEAGIAVLAGLAIGLGGYTFVYAKGYSYLLNDPDACANCHIMRDQLDGCIGCGCLSLGVCPLYNPADKLGKLGPGPQILDPTNQ